MTRKDAEFAVALLRGINVGGKNKIPMRSLVSIFTAAGCTDVKTYIQSGNVLFRRYNLIGLPEEISSALHLASGFTVPVILRKAREMQDAAAKNPFLQRGLDPAQLHLMFLDRLPLRTAYAALILKARLLMSSQSLEKISISTFRSVRRRRSSPTPTSMQSLKSWGRSGTGEQLWRWLPS